MGGICNKKLALCFADIRNLSNISPTPAISITSFLGDIVKRLCP